MTTPDFPDWQQPTSSVERFGIIASYTQVLNCGGQTPNYDVSRWQSVTINVAFPLGGAVGDRYCLSIIWYDNPSTMAQENITFHGALSYGASGNFAFQTPVRAGTMFMQLVGPAGQSLAYYITATTLNPGASRLFYPQPAKWPLAALQGGVSLGAGASSPTIYMPPVDKCISGRFTGSAGPGVYRFIAPYLNNGAMSTTVIQDIPTTTLTNNIQQIFCPRMGLEVSAINSDTVARTLGYNLFDVS